MYFETLLVIHELLKKEVGDRNLALNDVRDRLRDLEKLELTGEKIDMGVLKACRDELSKAHTSLNMAEEALCDFEDQDFR